jgi:hypothetical protein
VPHSPTPRVSHGHRCIREMTQEGGGSHHSVSLATMWLDPYVDPYACPSRCMYANTHAVPWRAPSRTQ